jgi:RNA polymerase sigma-70 factor (ECF subfamily)
MAADLGVRRSKRHKKGVSRGNLTPLRRERSHETAMQTSEAELEALMLAALDGDARAYRALLGDLRLRLAGFFRRRLGGADAEADDLVQETLIAIHTRRETFDRAQALAPWVFAIARYKLVDHYRRRGRRVSVPIEDVQQELAVEGGAAAADARRDVEAALAQLSDRARRILLALKIEGASVAETAVRFGMSETAVKVASHRAMKTLAEQHGDGTPGDE